MVNQKLHDYLYKTYRKRPESPDELNIAPLFEQLIDFHDIEIDGEDLVIRSISPNSPFHRISLRRIHEIVEFADEVAIVLHSSIIYLNKNDNKVFVHMKMVKPNLWERIRHGLKG